MLSRKYSIIFLFASVAAALIIIINKLEYSPDDTFIYLQYARNLAGGDGFSFNAGEPSYGITSPLWALLLSVPYLLGFDGYWFSRIIDLFFALFSVVMFYKLSGIAISKLTGYEQDNKASLQQLSTGIFILNVWFLRWAFTGLETSLAVFIILSLTYAVFKDRDYLTSTLAGFLFLIRPESFIFFIFFVLYLLLFKKSWKKSLICILIFAVLIIPWIIYARVAFGTIVPNTALGKSTFTFSFSVITEQLKRIAGTVVFSDAVELILSALSIIYLVRKKRINEYLLIVFWILGLITLYIVTDADIISRYLLIMLPFFTLLGVQVLCVFPSKQKIIAVTFFIAALFQSQVLYYTYVQPHVTNFSQGLNSCLIPIGKWTNENTPQNSIVLVNDVGAIGYYSGRYIIDAAALINMDLDLNKKIMATPVDERANTANLLKFVKADYLVQRDAFPEVKMFEPSLHKLEFIYSLEFPGLGISDPSPRFYKVYRVVWDGQRP